MSGVKLAAAFLGILPNTPLRELGITFCDRADDNVKWGNRASLSGSSCATDINLVAKSIAKICNLHEVRLSTYPKQPLDKDLFIDHSLSPLLRLKNLRTFALSCHSFNLSPDFLLQISTSWPEIKVLILRGQRNPSPDVEVSSPFEMEDLIVLADCPILERLTVPINGIVLPDFFERHPLPTKSKSKLKELYFKVDEIINHAHLAFALCGAFPLVTLPLMLNSGEMSPQVDDDRDNDEDEDEGED